MAKEPLGRLDPVLLREYWTSESAEFTPWLGREENIDLLSEALDLELKVEALEKDVGSFRADILCTDNETGQRILIENQLEKTNHSHLGQIITYAAGLDAKIVVWIAKEFAEEHRQALEWLNENSIDGFHFFGVEVELWRIGSSPPAPKFNIVVKPNDWTKTIRSNVSGGELSSLRLLQLEYWKVFAERLKARKSPLPSSDANARHSMRFKLGRSGFSLVAHASSYNSELKSYETGEIRASLYIQNREAELAYARLLEQREGLEKLYGGPLQWAQIEDVNRRRIFVRKDARIADRSTWQQQHDWLQTNLENLLRVFGPRIADLP